jgi:hypothetical protein
MHHMFRPLVGHHQVLFVLSAVLITNMDPYCKVFLYYLVVLSSESKLKLNNKILYMIQKTDMKVYLCSEVSDL